MIERRRWQRGFTLLEVLVALTVLSLMIGMGYPGMMNFISNSRMSGAAAAMVAQINHARSEAISKGTYVSLYATSGGSTSAALGSGFSSSTAGWSDGWRELSRTLVSGSLSSTGTLIAQTRLGYDPTKNISVRVVRVTTGTNTVDTDTSVFSFNRNGQLVSESGALLSRDVQVWICDAGRTGEKGRRLVVSARGNVKNRATTDTSYVNPCT